MNLPSYFQRVKPMPDDPLDSTAYGTASPECEAFALDYEIPLSGAMPFADDASIIRGIHNTVSDLQTLIEVNSGVTKSGLPFVYPIIKTQMEPHGIQYTLLLQIKKSGETVSNLKAFFSETGMIGTRDAQIYSALVQQGIMKDGDNARWFRDPYDNSIRNRFLMNLSELEQFDEYFQAHTLSILRKTVKEIIELN